MLVGRTRARDRSRGKAVGLPPLAVLDFTALTAGALASLPGLSFERASSATVQTGTSTLVTAGIGSNVARAGRLLDAHNVGWLLEEARTNLVHDCRALDAASWSAGTGTLTVSYANGPDGSALSADRFVTTSGGFSPIRALGSQTATIAASAWLRHPTASGQYQLAQFINASTGAVATGTADTTWRRVACTRAWVAQSPVFVPSDGENLTGIAGGLAAGIRDMVVDLSQCEVGGFASSAIVTSGGTATRAGERGYRATGADYVDNGRVTMVSRSRPLGSSSQYANDMYLWRTAADTHARVSASTGAVIVTVGGSAYTTPVAMTWAALDLVEIVVAAGGGVLPTLVKYRVNNGSWTTLSTGTPPTQAAIAAAGALDVMSNGTAGQFSAVHERAEFHRAGVLPAWAA
jgi:hypothetical protein